MTKEKVFFEDTEHELEIKPINLVFNNSFGESVYLERIMIDPEMTLKYYETLKEIDPVTARFFKMAVPDFPYEITKEILDDCLIGFRHLIGLFSLTVKFFVENVKFGWKYPESHIHPRYQGNLADILILLNNKEKLIKFLKE
jgi:hypothetical protein